MNVDIAKRKRVMERSQKLGHCICDAKRPCPCDVFKKLHICPCAGERPEPVDVSTVKLTQLVRNAGCASKIAPADLEAVLGRLPEVKDSAVISGLAAADDAAIYRISDNTFLVQTVDVFTPCVDDPFLFGKICAANCLSDVYATGGEPRTALSVLAFPSETLSGEIMYQMLSGAMETLTEAGCALVGGHSIKDEEIKLGFAITGVIDPAAASSLEQARTGDVLVLTKPLGTGILAFCQQIGQARAEGMKEALQSMKTLNRDASIAMRKAGASACTDITGFGLFGHLMRLARQSKLSAQVNVDSLPTFNGVLDAIRSGVIPGAVERNREFVGNHLKVESGIDEARVTLGFDAQTSGGLLIAVPADHIKVLMAELLKVNVMGTVIGHLGSGEPGDIELAGDQLSAMAADVESAIPAPAHTFEEGCCADLFNRVAVQKTVPIPASEPEPVGSGTGTAMETQRAFGALMRSVGTAGALNEKTKELILFSQVLSSRCAPCFDAHYTKALKMGITQEELDEAAWCAIAMGGAPVRMFYQEKLEQYRKEK